MLKRLRSAWGGGERPDPAPFARAGAPEMPPASWEAIMLDCQTAIDPSAELASARNAAETAFYAQSDRVAGKWTHYLEVYDRYLSRYRERPVRFLEIGVMQGGSLQVWRRYFGARAVLHGLDINSACARIDDPDLTIHIGSQTDRALLAEIVSEMGGIDVVIDDGSHVNAHQIETFDVLYPLLAADGVYIVEDVHTSYWAATGGGLRSPGSFIEYAKALLDRLHARYVLDTDPAARDPGFADITHGIAFHDSMVVFEKRAKGAPKTVTVGHRTII